LIHTFRQTDRSSYRYRKMYIEWRRTSSTRHRWTYWTRLVDIDIDRYTFRQIDIDIDIERCI